MRRTAPAPVCGLQGSTELPGRLFWRGCWGERESWKGCDDAVLKLRLKCRLCSLVPTLLLGLPFKSQLSPFLGDQRDMQVVSRSVDGDREGTKK